ncbi:MAG: magnesium chelatase, partial [Gemmataceae bacterium]
YRSMIASARRRAVVLGEKPAVPRISDLGHLYSSALGKLELDLMGSHQISEKQVLDALVADAVNTVFKEYLDQNGLDDIVSVFGKGVKIEVGDMLPSSNYAQRMKVIPKAWEKAFEVNPSESDGVRASCMEFVLAGLHASDRISRSQKHGRISYEV